MRGRAVSSIINPARAPQLAASFRALIGRRPVVVSFTAVTEIRYGAIKAGWADLRLRGLERDVARLVLQPDDRLIRTCAELRSRCEDSGHRADAA